MLTETEFRTLLLAVVGGAIVLGAEVVAIGLALSGSSLAAVVLWLGGGVIAALAIFAYGSGRPGATRRLVEAAAVSLGVFLVVYRVDYDGLGGLTFSLAYAGAVGAGATAALPERTPGRLAARLLAVAAAAALVVALEANTTVHDLGYFLPGFVAAAVGIADVVVDTVERRRMLLGVALAVVPAAFLAGGVVLEDEQRERDVRAQRVAAQPGPATVGRERIAWMFPADGFNSGPLVAGDVVVADTGDAVHGLDAETGRELWSVRIPGRDGLTEPVTEARTLYYPANLAGLYAIDVQSGRRRWRFAPADADVLGAVPHRDGLVAAAWNPPGIVLYGLDPETGRQRWRRVLDGDGVDLSPHPAGARLETEAGHQLVDPSTGRLTPMGSAEPEYTYGNPAALRSRSRGWLYRLGWEAATSEPLELDGRVFVNIDLWQPKATGGLYVLDERTGRLQWRVEIAGDSVFKPAARGNLVYVTSTEACAALGGCRSGLYAIRHR